MLLASSRRLIFCGPVITLGLTGKGLKPTLMKPNETYSEAKRQFSNRNRTVLMNGKSPHKWRYTLKSVLFGTSSPLSPLVSEGGGLVCQSVGKADLLDHFDSKQSREAVIYRSLAVHLLVLPPLPSGLVRLRPLWWHPYGQPSGHSLLALLCGYWRRCVIYTDTVSVKPIQHVMVDGCRSKLADVVLGVPQGSVLGPLLFLLYSSELLSILENKLIGYADDSTLIAIVPSPGVRRLE